MVATTEIQGTQGSVTAVGLLDTTPSEEVYTFSTSAVVNFPTELVNSETFGITATVRRTSDINVTNLAITAVVRGRIQSPYALAWTFTLEGHDYYVINLYEETLVYDLSQQKWYSWGSLDSKQLGLRYGLNWVQTSAMAFDYGTNIVCGDDSTGAMFFLDPTKVDDDSSLGVDGETRAFDRIVYGQFPVRGNTAQPCYGVQLFGSLGDVQDPTLTSIQLEYSDDQGNTFVDAGTIDMVAGSYNQRIYWRSLGSMTQPGRLFRLTDSGGLLRLDGLDIDDNDPSTPQ